MQLILLDGILVEYQQLFLSPDSTTKGLSGKLGSVDRVQCEGDTGRLFERAIAAGMSKDFISVGNMDMLA